MAPLIFFNGVFLWANIPIINHCYQKTFNHFESPKMQRNIAASNMDKVL